MFFSLPFVKNINVKIKAFTIIFVLTCCALQTFSQRENQSLPNVNIPGRFGNFPFRKRANKEQKKQLQGNSQDLFKYAPFLQQPKTGMFRLLPDLGCEENDLILRADETCLKSIPESSFYSFREEEHTAEIISDLRLKNNYLVSDGILSTGILVNLGDIELGRITLESDGIGFLKEFVPQKLNREASKQSQEIVKGIKSGKYLYKRFVPAVENNTYAFRIVAYKGNVFRSYRGFRFDLLEGDKRIDMILAFRVIRKDKDGSITVLWKELQRKESPKLEYPKRNSKK